MGASAVSTAGMKLAASRTIAITPTMTVSWAWGDGSNTGPPWENPKNVLPAWVYQNTPMVLTA